jgi:hypothetical protein
VAAVHCSSFSREDLRSKLICLRQCTTSLSPTAAAWQVECRHTMSIKAIQPRTIPGRCCRDRTAVVYSLMSSNRYVQQCCMWCAGLLHHETSARPVRHAVLHKLPCHHTGVRLPTPRSSQQAGAGTPPVTKCCACGPDTGSTPAAPPGMRQQSSRTASQVHCLWLMQHTLCAHPRRSFKQLQYV